ncbi:MAG TPA: hypothetical protein VGF36_09005, partial [Rhodopila sp.]
MGILLAAHYDKAVKLASRCPVVFLAGAIAALCLPSDTANGVGGALLIMAVLGSGVLTKILRLAPFRWLGRVSYSLYL